MDRSLYFKGLLLLIRRDKIIRDSERDLMMHVGKHFGFETRFCENTIRDALINPYIEEVPPRFSDRAVAERFIRDGIRLSLADGQIHESESRWLKDIAHQNGIDDKWCLQAFRTVSEKLSPAQGADLEAFHLEWL
jgi:hypothetical protein